MAGQFFGGPKRRRFLNSYLRQYVEAQKTIPNTTNILITILLARYFKIFTRDLEVDLTGKSKIRVGREVREGQIRRYFNNHTRKSDRKRIMEEEILFDSDTEDDDPSEAEEEKSTKKKTALRNAILRKLLKIDKDVIMRALCRGFLGKQRYATPDYQIYQNLFWEEIEAEILEAYRIYCARMKNRKEEPMELLPFQNIHARIMLAAETDDVKETVRKAVQQNSNPDVKVKGETDEEFLERKTAEGGLTSKDFARNIGDLIYDFLTIVKEETGFVGMAYIAGEDPDAEGSLKSLFLEIGVKEKPSFSDENKDCEEEIKERFKGWAMMCIDKELVDPTAQPHNDSNSRQDSLKLKGKGRESADEIKKAKPRFTFNKFKSGKDVEDSDSSAIREGSNVTKPVITKKRLRPRQKFYDHKGEAIDLCNEELPPFFTGTLAANAVGKESNPFVIDSEEEQEESKGRKASGSKGNNVVKRKGKDRPHYEEVLDMSSTSPEPERSQKGKGKAIIDILGGGSKPLLMTPSSKRKISEVDSTSVPSPTPPRRRSLTVTTPTPESRKTVVKNKVSLPKASLFSSAQVKAYASIMNDPSILQKEREKKLEALKSGNTPVRRKSDRLSASPAKSSLKKKDVQLIPTTGPSTREPELEGGSEKLPKRRRVQFDVGKPWEDDVLEKEVEFVAHGRPNNDAEDIEDISKAATTSGNSDNNNVGVEVWWKKDILHGLMPSPTRAIHSGGSEGIEQSIAHTGEISAHDDRIESARQSESIEQSSPTLSRDRVIPGRNSPIEPVGQRDSMVIYPVHAGATKESSTPAEELIAGTSSRMSMSDHGKEKMVSSRDTSTPLISDRGRRAPSMSGDTSGPSIVTTETATPSASVRGRLVSSTSASPFVPGPSIFTTEMAPPSAPARGRRAPSMSGEDMSLGPGVISAEESSASPSASVRGRLVSSTSASPFAPGPSIFTTETAPPSAPARGRRAPSMSGEDMSLGPGVISAEESSASPSASVRGRLVSSTSAFPFAPGPSIVTTETATPSVPSMLTEDKPRAWASLKGAKTPMLGEFRDKQSLRRIDAVEEPQTAAKLVPSVSTEVKNGRKSSLAREVILSSLDAYEREKAAMGESSASRQEATYAVNGTSKEDGLSEGEIEYPKHFRAPEKFLQTSLGKDFPSLLKKVIYFESLLGFPEGNESGARISTVRRPGMLGYWNRGNRSFTKLPVIKDISDYVTAVHDWYVEENPDWKKEEVETDEAGKDVDEAEGSNSVTKRKEGVKRKGKNITSTRAKLRLDATPTEKETWSNLAIGGKFGFQSFVLAVAFGWIHPRLGMDSEERECLKLLAEDMERVLGWMIDYIEKVRVGEKRPRDEECEGAEGSVSKKAKMAN